jgi:hypothetical protein
MNVPYLRQLAFERFISLLLNKSKGDTRSTEELRQAAAREVVREQRIAGKSQSTPFSQNTTANSFETLFNRIWKIVTNQRAYAELIQRGNLGKVRKLKITPTIIDAPIVCDEPNVDNVNIVQFPKKEKAAPLVVTGNGGAKLIEDEEFIPRFIDQTTSNWRASIQQNQAIAKEREARSIQHRNQSSRWIG